MKRIFLSLGLLFVSIGMFSQVGGIVHDPINNIPIVLYTIIFIGLFIILGGMFYINIVPDIQYEQLVNLESILKQER